MLVDELRVPVATQKHAKIIEPTDDALQLHTIDEKHRDWRLVLPDVVKKHLLKVLIFLVDHRLGLFFSGLDRHFFRRRFLGVKQKLRDEQIGRVTSVVTRAFMNRMVPDATLRKVTDTTNLTPMVVSGTHSLDMSMWLLEGRTPVEVYARSTDVVLGPMGTKDGTFGVFTMDDGTIFSMNINWALPAIWPGAVYGLEIGIVGTEGVIDIEDTHRDVIVASEHGQPAGYNSRGFEAPATRNVDFLGSYPPGDLSDGLLWGPMREETMSWFSRLCMGVRTPHATAAEGHSNLLLTMAMDLSARRGRPVALPLTPEELQAGLREDVS